MEDDNKDSEGRAIKTTTKTPNASGPPDKIQEVDTHLELLKKLLVSAGEGQTRTVITDTEEEIKTLGNLLDKINDWDRRNQFKLCKAIFLAMFKVQFREAGRLLRECLPTFTAIELVPFQTMVKYVIIFTMISEDTKFVREKVLSSPEVCSEAGGLPSYVSLMEALVHRRFKEALPALLDVLEDLATDKFLARHVRLILRRMRLVFYKNYLEPFRSVKLSNMASEFGVSEAFLERDLESYKVADSRLLSLTETLSGSGTAPSSSGSNGLVEGYVPFEYCIDRVSGCVERMAPDVRQEWIKRICGKSDELLGKLQYLSNLLVNAQ